VDSNAKLENDIVSVSAAELKIVLEQIFEERSRIDSESHAEHHAWIKERIEAERARKEAYREITKTAIGWSVPFILIALSTRLLTGHWPQLP